MIYPELHIALDGTESIQLIDTNILENPIIEFEVGDEASTVFNMLLTAFLNQYNVGFGFGYGAAMQDIEDEDEDDEDEWENITDGEY